MKKVKILEVEKEVLKRLDMICRFACCKYSIKQGSIINIKGSNIAYVILRKRNMINRISEKLLK